MATIVLEGVSKRFTPSEVAVDDLSLVIPDGEFVCLLGPSGCGKTTTLRMIAGLEQPTSGHVKLDGRILSSPEHGEYVAPEKRGMGLVFQSYALWPHLTVAGNVEFGLRMQKWSSERRAERVREVLAMVDVAGQIDRYPSELSGGQQQRVALARMLAVDPEVLLLDEPLSNLDATLRLAMRSELKRIHHQTGSTVVFVTHDQFEAMTLATLIAVMDKGRLQQVAQPMELYRRPANRFVAGFLGNPQMNFVPLSGESPLAVALETELQRFVGQREIGLAESVDSIGIRPESIRIGGIPEEPTHGSWSFPMKVAAILPTGASWIVELSGESARLFAITDSEPTMETEQEVECQVSVKSLHFFGADGDRITSLDALADLKDSEAETETDSTGSTPG